MEPVNTAVESHLPGRAMPGHGVLLVTRDGILTHPGKIVVGMVVFSHVLEAEPPILPLAQPALRRAVGRLKVAARPLANRRLTARPAILLGLDPDAVEQRRVEFNDRPLCGRRRCGRKLDKTK